MKRTLTISVQEENLSAMEMYLEQKGTSLSAEVEKHIEQLYSKIGRRMRGIILR